MIAQYIIAFFIGLQATLHCVGMCGPLAIAAPIDRSKRSSAFWGSLSYNIGRISTYAYLGFLFGLFGISTIWLHGIQVLSVLSGALFISTAIFGSIDTWRLLQPITIWIGRFNSRLFPEIKKVSPQARPYLFGLLNGLLPCGMVYLALFYAISGGNLSESVLRMLFFGIGTVPVMIFIPLIGQEKFYRVFPRKTQTIMLITIGLLLIIRGLGLGIPYLSPAIHEPLTPHAQPTVECCEVQK